MTLAADHVAGGAGGHSTAQRHTQRLEGRAGQAVAALDVACAVLIVQRLDSTLFSCHQVGMGFSFLFFAEKWYGIFTRHVILYTPS